MHHPRFGSGNHGNDVAYIPFWDALQDAGAEVVLAGHEHNYERFAPQDAFGNADPNGLRQFVVGTGGRDHCRIHEIQANSEVRKSGAFGVLKLNLHPSSYDWEFVTEAGETFSDFGSSPCH